MIHMDSRRRLLASAGCFTLLLSAGLLLNPACRELKAAQLFGAGCNKCNSGGCGGDCAPGTEDIGGSWFWMRSPEQERAVIAGYFNRYCIRCHGIDGRGVWDIPGVPDFTNARWQAYRSDGQIVRIIIEGRGAVMPPFRGTLTLEEAWAMARYLRTFDPSTTASRPDLGSTDKMKTSKTDVPGTKK
jgi:Cytochrome C oxidase, cbb3-type, subunit III